MNPLPGEIFLDGDFALQNGVIKPMYLMVACDTPAASQSVLFTLVTPLAEAREEGGPDWEWPERFVVKHYHSPLNRPTTVMIDDVYRASSVIMLQRCRYIGSFDTRLTADILASLGESPGISRKWASAIRDVAHRLSPHV